jgi:hypothetical protein
MSVSMLRLGEIRYAAHFQLWTDALTFREMAKQAVNNSLRSMSVRNAVLSAWTTLEMACCDALAIPKLPNDFKQSLDEAFDAKGLQRLDFSSGLWHKINDKIKGYRKKYAHSGVDILDRFPPVSIAEEAIETIRKAIHDIYAKTNKPVPPWANRNQSSGWPQTLGVGISFAALTVDKRNGDSDPNFVSIILVRPTGVEDRLIMLPANAPEEQVANEAEGLLQGMNYPYSRIRVYRGSKCIEDAEI